MNIVWKGSPNYTQGRTHNITVIVPHWIVGTLATADSVFSNPNSAVSAHYGIGEGKIHQYVKEANTAWHAVSANPYSIGIEHSAAPGRAATASTYDLSIQLCADICKRYKLNPQTAIQPHNLYVQTRCPGSNSQGTILESGGLDINRIRNGAEQLLKGGNKMITSHGLFVLFRFYRGDSPTKEQVKRYVGKITFDALSEQIRKGAVHNSKVQLAKEGKLNAANHLPSEIRTVYKPPEAQPAEQDTYVPFTGELYIKQ